MRCSGSPAAWRSASAGRGSSRSRSSIGSAVTHLAKGLDIEEATGALAVLCLLLVSRRQFVAPGDPESIRPLIQVVLALAVVVTITLLHADGTVASSDRVDDSLAFLTGALAVRAFFLWLRPIAERVRHIPADRRRAEALVQEHGHDSLAYFALRRDKSTFFSRAGAPSLPTGSSRERRS